MSDQLTRIEENLSKLVEVVSAHAVTLGRMDERLGFYNNQLKIHIKRTEMNEAAIKTSEASIDTRLKPIETHVKKVSFFFKMFKWALGLVVPAVLALALKKAFG